MVYFYFTRNVQIGWRKKFDCVIFSITQHNTVFFQLKFPTKNRTSPCGIHHKNMFLESYLINFKHFFIYYHKANSISSEEFFFLKINIIYDIRYYSWWCYDYLNHPMWLTFQLCFTSFRFVPFLTRIQYSSSRKLYLQHHACAGSTMVENMKNKRKVFAIPFGIFFFSPHNNPNRNMLSIKTIFIEFCIGFFWQPHKRLLSFDILLLNLTYI